MVNESIEKEIAFKSVMWDANCVRRHWVGIVTTLLLAGNGILWKAYREVPSLCTIRWRSSLYPFNFGSHTLHTYQYSTPRKETAKPPTECD